jgi:hypothetical protein
MSAPISLSIATAVQLADGTWYTLTANTLGAVIDPAFTDPTTGNLIVPGDQWVQFVDSLGQAYAAPFRAVLAVKLGAPVA